MLSTSEIELLRVDDQVLTALPEDIVREYKVLPIARDESGLHVIIPASTPDQEESTVDEIRYYAVDDHISYQTAEAADLSAKIDYLYSQLKSSIHRCGRRFFFRFRCPKVWTSLTPTSNPEIRFCDVCNKNVYYAFTEDELQMHSRAGHCIAYSERDDTYGELIGDVVEVGEK